MCLAVLRTVLWDCPENLFRVGAKDGELHEVSGVEQHIGVFLKRIDPLHLGAAHVRPIADGLLRAECAFVVVADDSAEEAVVAGRDAVVVVNGDAGDGVDEDAELAICRNLVGQTRVKGVDSLNEEHRVRFELQGLAVVLADSSHEVVFWHLHRLAGEKPEDVLLEGYMIDGVEVIEVVVAIG